MKRVEVKKEEEIFFSCSSSHNKNALSKKFLRDFFPCSQPHMHKKIMNFMLFLSSSFSYFLSRWCWNMSFDMEIWTKIEKCLRNFFLKKCWWLILAAIQPLFLTAIVLNFLNLTIWIDRWISMCFCLVDDAVFVGTLHARHILPGSIYCRMTQCMCLCGIS